MFHRYREDRAKCRQTHEARPPAPFKPLTLYQDYLHKLLRHTQWQVSIALVTSCWDNLRDNFQKTPMTKRQHPVRSRYNRSHWFLPGSLLWVHLIPYHNIFVPGVSEVQVPCVVSCSRPVWGDSTMRGYGSLLVSICIHGGRKTQNCQNGGDNFQMLV